MIRFDGFTAQRVAGAGATLQVQVGGQGPGLLLLHGHPQTHAIWQRVAAGLARHFTVVAADLRGYGDSDKPPSTPDHAPYGKRAMAADFPPLMHSLGFERFSVLAHDRGARVAHRLAADHPHRVERLTLLDIAPTLAMYEQTSMAFATAYWHWFFLIQPAPFPETLIAADPAFYLRSLMGGRHAGLAPFTEAALAEYERNLRDPQACHAMCEDYRAAATLDLQHDRADRDAGRRLPMPLPVLWGEQGVIGRCFDPLAEWRRVADDVVGRALPCGHYIPEEAPDALLREALPFLLASSTI